MRKETIFAVATPPGRGGIAIIRISGPQARMALHRLTDCMEPPARRLVPASIQSISAEIIDRGLIAWFPAPGSYTGEDVAELHLHGSLAVVSAVTGALAALNEVRLAEPGEFTRRAFENGKLDLTAAEGIADIINAETAAQRRQALRQLDGALGQLYEDWRRRLVMSLAHIEAMLDFSDEDLPDALDAAAKEVLRNVGEEISIHLNDGHRGERIRDGVAVAIVGPPNAGKSSLLNTLSRREAAIVTPEPGTTRDVIEVALDLRGFPVVLADTAGIRADAAGSIEAEGIRRARQRAENADFCLVVFDGAAWPRVNEAAAKMLGPSDIGVVSKVDLGGVEARPCFEGREIIAVSAVSGAGVDKLVEVLANAIADRYSPGAAPSLTRLRHRTALQECLGALRRAEGETAMETVAEELRAATQALGMITGRVGVEDVLDVVFRDFCIGK